MKSMRKQRKSQAQMSKCRVRTRAQNSPLELETEDDGDTSTIKETYIRTENEPIKSLDTRMQKIGAGTGDCCRWAKAGIVAIIIVIGRAGLEIIIVTPSGEAGAVAVVVGKGWGVVHIALKEVGASGSS